MRGRGGFIGANVTPAAAAINSAASGVWNLREAEALKRAGTWPRVFEGPTGVSGLQLWLDAADASTLYDATSGGSLVAADGGVARWEDKSGNSRHATQATSGNRPLRKTAIQGGRDVLRFDGTNDCFSLPSLTTTSSYVSFFVFRRTSQGIHSIALGPGAASGNYSAWWFSDNVLYESSTNNASVFTTHGSASTLTGSFLIVTTRTATTSIATRRNGSALATVSSGAGVTNAAGGSWSAVGRGDGNNLTHNGDICEIILYDSALSDANRSAVESYLLTKWGIT